MKKVGVPSLIWSGLKLNFLQSSWNFERLQNIGFLFSMNNMLKRIYKEDRTRFLQSLKRHIGFFNTHIFFSSAVLGVMTRLEEELPDTDPQHKEAEIESTKMGMMGPLAALGDSLFWSGLKPLALLAGVCIVWLTGFSKDGWVAAAVVSLAVYNLPRVVIKYFLLIKSYYQYKELFVLIQKVKFQDIMKSIKVAGMGLLGVVMAVYFMKKELSIISQKWLDSVLLFFVFWMVTVALRKKKSPTVIFAFMLLISLILAYIF
jgi:PTS system mannose-specific IID component